MSRKIHVNVVSTVSIVLTVLLGAACVGVFWYGGTQFQNLSDASQTYIECEEAAKDLKEGCDYLTEQARLAAVTGSEEYIDNYFEEIQVTRTRETAIAVLERNFPDDQTIASLKKALERSYSLQKTEIYAMRLVAEANGSARSSWPVDIQKAALSANDADLSADEMLARARGLTTDEAYQSVKIEIMASIEDGGKDLVTRTENAQGRASSIFWDVYRKLGGLIVAFGALTLGMAVVVRRLIIRPLVRYHTSIENGEPFPVAGAAELQQLAETYNRAREENEEAQMLIRHQAEHDPLTDLLNRGSFDRILDIYEKGSYEFALIIVDVDTFKQVNDSCGHAVGDAILRRVARLLKTAFRSIDHVCRIGGDEFAVVMVEMTPDLAYTISDKIAAVNARLAMPEDGMPTVSLSVGVAFSGSLAGAAGAGGAGAGSAEGSDEAEAARTAIFTAADQALYHTKEHGRNGCTFFEDL